MVDKKKRNRVKVGRFSIGPRSAFKKGAAGDRDRQVAFEKSCHRAHQNTIMKRCSAQATNYIKRLAAGRTTRAANAKPRIKKAPKVRIRKRTFNLRVPSKKQFAAMAAAKAALANS